MNNTINRAELLKKLVMAKPAASTQSFIPILTHFLFADNQITAYNDINAITVECDTGLHCCLPVELLIKTLSSMSSESITMSQDGAQVVVKAGKSKIRIPSLEVESYPVIQSKKTRNLFSFTIDALMLDGLKKCLIGIGTDAAHPATMGVTFDSFYSDTEAAFYSTDNVTISRFIFETDNDQLDPIIMPSFFCTQLLALAKDSQKITVQIFEGALLAKFEDGTTLFTKIIADLQPMDFPQVINRYFDSDKGVMLNIPDAFDKAIERALLVQSSESFRSTQVTVERGKLILESKSQFGEATDEMEFDSDDVKFRIDPARVKRILQVTSKMALLPNVMVLTDDKQDFIHLIAHCSN